MNKKRLLIIIGIVAAVVILVVVLDTMLANRRPVITNLEGPAGRVLTAGGCQIVCTAQDADGDDLSYNWSASGGEIAGQGSAVVWKAPSIEGSYNITVIVSDGRGGEATTQITITARANRPPVVTNLTAEAEWALPSGSLNVTCVASDLDNDSLTYEWSATAGNITGTGPAVNWTAPQEVGVCNITVVVTDGYGGSDTATLPVSVVTGQPPTIEQLLITADHCYLKTNTVPYRVGKKQLYHIRCLIPDSGIEVSYQWSATGGTISGDGSSITWTAPDKSGKVTITVTVSDIAGNPASRNLVLSVVDCSPCTFGC